MSEENINKVEEEAKNELVQEEELAVEDSTREKLGEVETKTGEEDEETLVAHRCKAFRFDEGENEWKERGKGEIRILKHKETGVARIILRRDKTLKIAILCNICETGPLLESAASGEKGWCFTSMDYSEDEDATRETFIIKFTSKEASTEFKKQYLENGGTKGSSE